MHVNSMLTKYILIVCVIEQQYSTCSIVIQMIEKHSKKRERNVTSQIVSFLFYPA